MTEAAKIKASDRVLEIGTGSGYQAAVLGELAKEVYTIEICKSPGGERPVSFGKIRIQEYQSKMGRRVSGLEGTGPL